MKRFFRHLTAEANGFYLKGLNGILNEVTVYFYEALSYLRNVVWKIDDDPTLTNQEYAITDKDLRDIAKIAGVFTPFISAESNLGSLAFTSSKIVDGVQYSERGLFDMLSEGFKFFRTAPGSYGTDITTLATKYLRSSLVPEGAPILGYIEEGSTVLTEDGQIIPSAILPSPPVDKAYYPYYGEKYLFLAENFLIEAYLDLATFKELFESFQRIRYNGASIAELANITKALMDDFVYDIDIVQDGQKFIMYYKLNQESELVGKTKRLYIWRMLLRQKYKQFALSEVIS